MKFFQSGCLLVATILFVYVGVVDRRVAPLALGLVSGIAFSRTRN